ncbi:MAG: glycosyltransferase family 2 protein, partial [Planctomycetota bacterium]
MKLTLVFGIFNKAYHLDRLLSSWLDTLSGVYQYEVIVVCDACVDGSQEVAQDTLSRYGDVLDGYQIVETPDVYEIAQNNTALGLAAEDSELILFIQDDNFMFDENWDAHLFEARCMVPFPGATALLAGGVFLPDGRQFKRIESQRPHKGEHFTKHGIDPDEFPPAVYSVDFITRPFAVSTPQLRIMGGLGGEGWDVICWDDTDLSIKLLKAGYTNQYIALDVL